MASKSNIILWRCFLAFSLFTLYSLILTLNYNSPQIMQFVAHYHFKEIEISYKKERPNNFSCIAYNCAEPFQGIYSKNRSECYSRHYTKSDYYYELEGKKYYVSRYAYTGGTFNCLKGGYIKAYYFPLIPSWSVLDNRPLKQEEIRELKASLDRFSYVLYVLAVLAVVCFYKLKPFKISRLFQLDAKLSSFIVAVSLPLIIKALMLSLRDFQTIDWLLFSGPDNTYLSIAKYIFILLFVQYGISLILLFKISFKQQKLRILYIVMFLIGHRVLEISIMILMRPLG